MGNFQAIKLLRGRHRHVIYHWKALVLTKRPVFGVPTGNKQLNSKIFDFVNFLQEKVPARTTFCQGGQLLKVARPAGGLFF